MRDGSLDATSRQDKTLFHSAVLTISMAWLTISTCANEISQLPTALLPLTQNNVSPAM